MCQTFQTFAAFPEPNLVIVTVCVNQSLIVLICFSLYCISLEIEILSLSSQALIHIVE